MAKRRIRLFLSRFSDFGGSIRDGLLRFAATRPQWRIETPRDLAELSPKRLAEADGYLGGFASNRLRQRLIDAGVTAVDLMHGEEPVSLPVVHNDEQRIGKTAAEYLIANGHRKLLFICTGEQVHARGRYRGFAAVAKDAGIDVDRLDWSELSRPYRQIARRLHELGAPVGAFASDDYVARRLLDVAESRQLRVPHDLAVLGVNDSIFCEFCDPPLSSVAPDWERIAFEGASLLERLMDGEPPPDHPILVPPQGVVVRQSSDALAISDEDVARAIVWIRDHATEPVNVEKMLCEIPVDRRTIERKFRRHLGHSPWQEIRRAQIEHVKRLLIHTDWQMPRVAEQSAFRDAKHLGEQFRKFTGVTPTAFRRQHRPQV